jgi:ADP-heptose:LPS heptosyltransferase
VAQSSPLPVKILLVRLDHLGDLLLTTPLIRALAGAGHAVEVVVRRAWLPVLEENPQVRESFSIEEIAPDFPATWRPVRDWMRSRRYEAVLLPNPEPRALLRCSLGSGIPRRLAMQAGIWGRLTGHQCLRVGPAMMSGRHFSDIELDLARALEVAPDGLKPDYFCREDEVLAAREWLVERFPDRAGAPVIGIHPGCAGNTCNLPGRVYGELAALVLERTGGRMVITGTAEERGLLESWPREVLDSPRVAVAMGAFDVRALAAVIGCMGAYVVPSTGPLHLAAALGVPTVSPFCTLPPIGVANWGNVSGPAAWAGPAGESCRSWCRESGRTRHCDFRGEVTAQDLWKALAELLRT